MGIIPIGYNPVNQTPFKKNPTKTKSYKILKEPTNQRRP
jgi:hypothetical protein